VTNGTLLTDDICRFLIGNKVRTIVSLDGDKELNDATKKFGDSHFDAVIANLKRYQKQLGATIRTTVSRANHAHLERILDCYLENDLRFVTFDEIDGGGDTSLCLTPKDRKVLHEQYDRLFDRVMKQNGLRNRWLVHPLSQTLLKLWSYQKNYHFCSAGRRVVAIDAQGGIYPCHRLIGDEAHSIGRLSDPFDWSKLEPWYRADINAKSPCSHCWTRYFCGGGCLKKALIENHSLFEPALARCATIRRRMELAIYNYPKLGRIDILAMLPSVFRMVRNSPGHILRDTDWQLLDAVERGWLRHF